MIRPFQSKDALSVAGLYLENLPTRFPDNQQAAGLLALFYRSLAEVGDIALVAEVRGEVVGFVCVVNSLQSIYRQQVRKHFLGSVLGLFRMILPPPQFFWRDFLGRVRQVCCRDVPSEASGPAQDGKMPELRPIVVRRDFRGTPAARSLVAAAEQSLRSRGICRYFLRVDRHNRRAFGFYEKMGFLVTG